VVPTAVRCHLLSVFTYSFPLLRKHLQGYQWLPEITQGVLAHGGGGLPAGRWGRGAGPQHPADERGDPHGHHHLHRGACAAGLRYRSRSRDQQVVRIDPGRLRLATAASDISARPRRWFSPMGCCCTHHLSVLQSTVQSTLPGTTVVYANLPACHPKKSPFVCFPPDSCQTIPLHRYYQ